MEPTTPDHEQDPSTGGLPERLDLAGYGGLGLALAGGIFGGPGGTTLTALGTLTTLAAALYFGVLLLAARAAARHDR